MDADDEANIPAMAKPYYITWIISLAPRTSGNKFRIVIFKLIVQNGTVGTWCDFADMKATESSLMRSQNWLGLIRIKSHYLSPCLALCQIIDRPLSKPIMIKFSNTNMYHHTNTVEISFIMEVHNTISIIMLRNINQFPICIFITGLLSQAKDN